MTNTTPMNGSSTASGPSPPIPTPTTLPPLVTDPAVVAALTAIHLHSSHQSAMAALQAANSLTHTNPNHANSTTTTTAVSSGGSPLKKRRPRKSAVIVDSATDDSDSNQSQPPSPTHAVKPLPPTTTSTSSSSSSRSTKHRSNNHTSVASSGHSTTFIGRVFTDILTLPWNKLLAALLCTFFIYISFTRITEFQSQITRLSVENAELRSHADSLVAKETTRLELHVAAMELRLIKLLQQEVNGILSKMDSFVSEAHVLDKRISQHDIRQQMMMQLQSHLQQQKDQQPSSTSGSIVTTPTTARIVETNSILLPPAPSRVSEKATPTPSLRLHQALKTIPSEVLSILDDHPEFQEEIARYRAKLANSMQGSGTDETDLGASQLLEHNDDEPTVDALQSESERLNRQLKHEL